MAQLARIVPAAAIACPSCGERLAHLPLDDLAAGDGYDCPLCGQPLRVPPQVLARLIEQRDAEPYDDIDSDEGGFRSFFARACASIAAVFRRLLE